MMLLCRIDYEQATGEVLVDQSDWEAMLEGPSDQRSAMTQWPLKIFFTNPADFPNTTPLTEIRIMVDFSGKTFGSLLVRIVNSSPTVAGKGFIELYGTDNNK